jgi:hypothetical protein
MRYFDMATANDVRGRHRCQPGHLPLDAEIPANFFNDAYVEPVGRISDSVSRWFDAGAELLRAPHWAALPIRRLTIRQARD